MQALPICPGRCSSNTSRSATGGHGPPGREAAVQSSGNALTWAQGNTARNACRDQALSARPNHNTTGEAPEEELVVGTAQAMGKPLFRRRPRRDTAACIANFPRRRKAQMKRSPVCAPRGADHLMCLVGTASTPGRSSTEGSGVPGGRFARPDAR